MDMRADFDWLSSTPDDRKALYSVARQLIVARQLTWAQLFRVVFGHNLAESYSETFGAGRGSKRKYALLHDWIRKNHPEYAAKLAPMLARSDDELPRLPPRFFHHAVPKMLSYVPDDPRWSRVSRSELARRLKRRLNEPLVDAPRFFE